MFISAQFIISKLWKHPVGPSTDEWVKKMRYLYTMEYYSAIKKDTFELAVGTSMDLETTMLSKIYQVQKVKSHMGSLIREIYAFLIRKA